MDRMLTQALLLWLVLYAGLFGAVGFVLYVARGFTRRRYSNVTLLRTASMVAFMLALTVWVLILVLD